MSITIYSWITLVAFSMLIIRYFSRWRPIWPPNSTNSHISAQKHDRETNSVLITMYSWTRNLLVASSTLASISFPRWRPIWLPNYANVHISAHKYMRDKSRVDYHILYYNIYSWIKIALVTFSTLITRYFSRWRPMWPPNHTNSQISAQKYDRKTNLVLITMYSGTRYPLVAFSTLISISFPRWRPIWPPNHANIHISAHKQIRGTNRVSITM